jgi:Flp pilus assembly protein TadD
VAREAGVLPVIAPFFATFVAVCKQRVGPLTLLLLLSGCAQYQLAAPSLSALDPLLMPDGELTPQVAAARAVTPDLLGLTPEMRDFADRYVKHGTQQQRLLVLHSSLKSAAMAGVQYDPDADGTAAEAFSDGRANCLTYAHLFVSLARYAGLNASYLSLTLRPEWSRYGSRVALRQHVNVRVKLRDGSEYVVDIDPVPRERIAAADLLSDDEAFALYHANLAMDDLLHDRYVSAYGQAVRALELSRNTDYLWVNLGAIYRRAGQDRSAEQSYMTALQLNPRNPSAMNNLGVMFEAQGELAQADLWAERVDDHRQKNPYYHMYLGAEAELAGEPEQAKDHYLRAIAIKDTDAEFYYQLAKLQLSLRQPAASRRYIELAIKHSRLVGERDLYREFQRGIAESAVARSDR